MASSAKYLTEATLFAPAANKWASDNGIMNLNGGLVVLQSGSNLSDVPDIVQARINLGLRIGADVQPYNEKLSAYSGGSAPSPFTLQIVSNTNGESWRDAIGAGTVRSVSLVGGSTGLTFIDGTITNSGTATLSGTLAIAHGGTGSTSIAGLKTTLSLEQVNNTSDADKPISVAVQAALDTKYNLPTGATTQYLRGDGSLATFPTVPSTGIGSVKSVSLSGGSTGLTSTGGPITESGSFVLGGILSVAHGGTGVSTLSSLRTILAINNVDNTSDAMKPISAAAATEFGRRVKIPSSLPINTTLELPAPVAGQVIGWNSSASALVNIDIADDANQATAYISVNVFDADGTTVAFLLSADPESIDNITVTVGGIGQTPGVNYTYDNQTLTFDGPPPAGVKIVVRFFRILASSVVTADQIVAGIFDGNIIPDDTDVHTALEALESAITTFGFSLANKVNSPTGLTNLTLPSPEVGKVIGWNPSLTGLINVEPGTGSGSGAAIAYTDIFVGDGVSSTFTLSNDPGSQDFITVSVGGVDQAPGESYTWSNGTGLVFSQIIPDEIRVIVRYMRAVGVGETDANLVSTSPFSGSIIPNGSTVQAAIQALETAIEEFDPSQNAGSILPNLKLFTGNGINTNFELDVSPGSLDNLDMYVSGIYQTPGTSFTWDGDRGINFSEAPPDATSVIARYANTLNLHLASTGWANDTGTAKRSANATYGATASLTYNSSEIQALMDTVRDMSRTLKAIKDDLIGQGIFTA